MTPRTRDRHWRTRPPLAGLVVAEPDVQSVVDAPDWARRARTQRLVRMSALTRRIRQRQHPLAVAVRDGLARLIPPAAYLRWR